MMFLVDTNIFLEILLTQDKKAICKKFLDKNVGNLHITDFSLHSIGVILFRYDKEVVFHKFVGDVLPNTKLLSLPVRLYGEIVDIRKKLNLDFDDASQLWGLYFNPIIDHLRPILSPFSPIFPQS